MKKVKHILCMILSFLIFVCIVSTSNTTILADEDENFNVTVLEENSSSLENGGFEQPVISGTTSQVHQDRVPYWKTTANQKKIELFRENTGQYIPGVKLTPREGKQGAELNADEISTLYQHIATETGKTYEWGLSHRGRVGTDTMALFIGPNQAVEPASVSKAAKDQFMKMADWLKTQIDVDIGLDVQGRQIGCSKKIIFYTKSFAGVGTFDGGDNDAFSWSSDDVHTEQWNTWIMTSGNGGWEDYGSAAASADYNFTYEVPENTPNSIFAFSAIQTANGKDTTGNLLDNISFKEYYNVEVYTTPGGKGTYVYDDYYSVDYFNNYTGKVLKGEGFSVMAHELKGADYRKFIGANINGEFFDVSAFTSDGRGNYGYSVIEGLDKHYKIRLIFSGKYITYDVNAGHYYVSYDDYQYDGTPNTGHEVYLDPTVMQSYTSHATQKYNDDGSINNDWRFVGWKYDNIANAITFDGVHTINYVSDIQNPSNDTFTITGRRANGTGIETITNIPVDTGITMVAQWKYRQGFISKLWDCASKSYLNNGECATIEIKNGAGETYQDVGKAYYADDGELVTATAIPNAGYEFNGWHDADGNLIGPGESYVYRVNDRKVSTAYAYFIKVRSLTVKNEVNGNLGDRDKYFDTSIHLENLETDKTFSLTYSNNGTIDTNPTRFTSDADGKCTIDCKLKHNGSISIKHIPEGAVYTIAEANYAPEGYSTTGTVLSLTSLMQDTTVTVVNTRNGEIPLGVNNDGRPYLYMAALSGISLSIFIIFYIKRKHKKS